MPPTQVLANTMSPLAENILRAAAGRPVLDSLDTPDLASSDRLAGARYWLRRYGLLSDSEIRERATEAGLAVLNAKDRPADKPATAPTEDPRVETLAARLWSDNLDQIGWPNGGLTWAAMGAPGVAGTTDDERPRFRSYARTAICTLAEESPA